MKKQRFKIIKAQTALEYLGAFTVFAAIGLGTFYGINYFLESNQADILAMRGIDGNYQSTDTILGKTLEGGKETTNPYNEVVPWPVDWSEPQEDLDGARPADIAGLGAEAESSWNNPEEQDLLAQHGAAGGHWTENERLDQEVDAPGVEETYTASELQGVHDDLVGQVLEDNQQGYTEAGMQQIQSGLNQEWFFNPPSFEPEPVEE